MSHFLWNNNEESHKYHLANWQLVAQKKEVGGFRIPDMREIWISLYLALGFLDMVSNLSLFGLGLLTTNIIPTVRTSYAVIILQLLPSGKGLRGLFKQLEWESSS